MGIDDDELLYGNTPDVDENDTRDDVHEINNNDNKLIIPENGRSDQLKIYTQHLYDDIFTYNFREQVKLFIPLINEAFGFEYDRDIDAKVESVTFYGKEFNVVKQHKRIADALISIGDNLFHFECESKNGEIKVRIQEYDSFIMSRHNDKTVFTAVVYIRENNLPANGYIEEDNRIIPYINVFNYSLDELKDKGLYVLVPYFSMRYEKDIQHNNSSEYSTIVHSFEEMYNVLEEAKTKNIIDNDGYSSLCQMCLSVITRISKGSTFREYYREAGVTPMAFVTMEKQIEQAKRETLTAKDKTTISLIKNLMDTSQESFDKVCEMLKIRYEDAVRYSKMM